MQTSTPRNTETPEVVILTGSFEPTSTIIDNTNTPEPSATMELTETKEREVPTVASDSQEKNKESSDDEFRNEGTCTWNPDYAIVFHSGDSMSAPFEVPFSETVQPGNLIDISADMRAPTRGGSHLN
jgi:hypothetical protein